MISNRWEILPRSTYLHDVPPTHVYYAKQSCKKCDAAEPSDAMIHSVVPVTHFVAVQSELFLSDYQIRDDTENQPKKGGGRK